MRVLHRSASSSTASSPHQRQAVDGIEDSRRTVGVAERPAKRWLRRIRGALLMGLTWAVAWAPIGVLVGMIVDPDGSMDEMWPAVGAYPGFLSGVVFSVVLAIAARRRRLHELSLS